ncbi:MAG: HD-GYP domain-containing protein [Lachnospiraceae bacterium]|nr:HD-GYP domain-containing protein [Lachnospiraceae bacterium]
MKEVEFKDLVSGMILARNICDLKKNVIFPEGYVLTSKAITKLSFYTVSSIFVEEHKIDEVSSMFSGHRPYSHLVKRSPEFQRFAKDFERDVYKFRDHINDVVERNAPIDIQDLMRDTLALLDNARGKIHIFEILYNMRQYDDSTYAHSINVALICNVLATWLHMSKEDVFLATQCGLLHDIGKLKIPEYIIKKPSRLTDEEYNIVKTHPLAGHDILNVYHLDPHIPHAALMHHERCDGTGYPFGLTGDKIDRFAKIVSIADVYDAMTSSRVYRHGLCPFKVISILEKEGFQKYDTEIILTFLQNVLDGYILNLVRLSDGRIGEVILINRSALSRPLIKCGTDYVDLSLEPPELYIDSIL